MEPFYPKKWDKILGSWITLPDEVDKQKDKDEYSKYCKVKKISRNEN